MKSKRSLSDAVSNKEFKRSMNPFEVHINRQKHHVLGKKSKAEKGLPGISRSRAIKKRKATLLQEYNLKSKNNKFFDRRIGERNNAMTNEDKVIARYTAERMRAHSKTSLYNLGDNEVLTHRGTNLADIEKFEDPRSDEDDDDYGKDNSGKLDQDFVADAHFGGGILSKTSGENKSRKDIIDQLIADSKKRKAEKQRLKEQTLDMTEKLDEEWKNLYTLVASTKPEKTEVELKSEQKYALFDKLSKELKFETRGKATDKLKTVEAIAKEEKLKLEKLEEERLRRMLGDHNKTKTIKHQSADDLDDGFDYNEDGSTLSRKKAKISEGSDSEVENNLNEESDVKENPSSETESSESEEESENEKEDDLNDVEGENPVDNGEKEKEDVDSGSESGDDSQSDDLSDLKDSEESEVEEDRPQNVKKKIKKNSKNNTDSDLKDLPYTLSVPETYEEFEELLASKTPTFQSVAVERMVKSNHPSLKDGSRQKMISLFMYILQHLQDVATESLNQSKLFRILDKLSQWLFELTQFAPEEATNAMCDIIKEKYEDFTRRPRKFPGLDTIVFFKVVSILFPTSDFRHRLVTPTMTFMQHVLTSCRVKTSTDVAKGLFISTLVLEYTVLSKRLVPEAINFIRGVLRCAQSRTSTLPYIPPFAEDMAYPLYISSTELSLKNLLPLSTDSMIQKDNSNDFKLRTIKLSLQLLREFVKNFEGPSAYLIFEPFIPLLSASNFSKPLKKEVCEITEQILSLKKTKLSKLMAEIKKPRPLKLYEPKIEDVYTFRKKSVSKEKEEHEKLVYKYKKEVKGALREIRRDNSFLAKLKFKEMKNSDMERQRKVKEIYGDAAQQMGDIRKIKRSK